MNDTNLTEQAQAALAADFIHTSVVIADFLDDLRAATGAVIDGLAGFIGPVTPQQAPWSRALDVLEAEREKANLHRLEELGMLDEFGRR